MSSFSRLLNITLGLTAVGCGVLAYQQYYLLESARNAVATLVIGQWVGELDKGQADRVLSGELPFDETTMLDDDEDSADAGANTGAEPQDTAPSAAQAPRTPEPVAR